MKSLTPLLAFSFLIGCDGEKSNVAPSKDSSEESATEAKPPKSVSIKPNLKYVIEGDVVTITGCAEDASGELVIAEKIEGKSVTNIGNEAFGGCTSLTSITIPDSVTSIGYGAFRNCTSLTAVTFLEDAPKIEDDAFEKSSPTIYRKADAKGWGDTLAGRPVRLITEKP